MNDELPDVNISGAETGASDTSELDEQTLEQAFEAGFADDTDGDGQGSEASDSKSNASDRVNHEDSQAKAKPPGAEPVKQPEKSENGEGGRPEKRDRTASSRISQLVAEKRQMAEQLAKYEADERARQAEEARLQVDEDGNLTDEQITDFVEQRSRQIASELIADSQAQLQAQAERATEAQVVAETGSMFGEIIRQNPIIDPDSPTFNDKVFDYVRGQALNAALTHRESGGKTAEIPAVMRQAISETLFVLKEAGSQSAQQAAHSLNDIRDSSALVSTNGGQTSETDPWLEGWDKD